MHPALSKTHNRKATLNGSLFCFSETLLNLWKQNTKQDEKFRYSTWGYYMVYFCRSIKYSK